MHLRALPSLLILAMGLSTTACASLSHDMSARMDAQQQQNNQSAVAVQRDNLERSYQDMAARIEMEEAKYQGHIQGLSEAAKTDPAFALIEKQHDALVAKNAGVAERYGQAMEKADSGDSSTAATQDFMRDMSGVQQDQANILTSYGRLYSEVMQLRGRH